MISGGRRWRGGHERKREGEVWGGRVCRFKSPFVMSEKTEKKVFSPHAI